jgi:purine-nucleoside phosphorylase
VTTTTSTDSPSLIDQRNLIKEAAEYIRGKAKTQPTVGIILGSGLGALADGVENAVKFPYSEIPGFSVSTAPGHAGVLHVGDLEGKDVAVMQGRVHAYEGYTQQQVTFPVRVMRALGIDTLIVTCAAGGLNHHFEAGDLMLIADHINLTGANPLVGPNDPEMGVRFPVMFDAYRPEYIKLARKVALAQGLQLREGVHAGITGPAFFTKAELRYLIRIGADTIGMSTVPEVIAATHAGIKVLGIATISDMAIPDTGHHATEQEILDVAQRVGPQLQRLVRGVLSEL